MYPLHKMSEVRGWSHNEMMDMSKRVFLRYYGYWYADRLNEERDRIWEEKKRELETKSLNNRQTLGMN